jgi:hypothetical protein
MRIVMEQFYERTGLVTEALMLPGRVTVHMSIAAPFCGCNLRPSWDCSKAIERQVLSLGAPPFIHTSAA